MDKWWVWYTDGLLLVKYVKRPSVLSVVASCYIPFFVILVRPAQSHSFVYSCESSKCKLVPLRHFNPETHMSDWLLIPHYSILESNVKVMRTKKIITYLGRSWKKQTNKKIFLFHRKRKKNSATNMNTNVRV